ncbi:hypothetical protein EC968_003552 [Mortierella alpina]|nr:hypothetical protein EC968_003552 [Mortierella alpina]
MDMIETCGHQRREWELGRNTPTEGLEHVCGLVIGIIVGGLSDLGVHNGGWEDRLEMLNVFDRGLEDRELMEVIFIHTGGDEVFELKDLVIDPFSTSAFDGRV